MRTAVELIRLRAPGDEMVQRARDTMERQVVHLSRLVDDLLDVSRITLGTIQLRQETVDLGMLARHAVESLGSAPQAAGLVLEQQIAGEPIFVRGDPTRLVQCVLNLLANAVKFTPQGGHIMLRVAQEGDAAVVEVSDSGSGISPENLENIFDLFVQEATSGLHGNTGLGIGLAITRRLVTLHGGTIRAASAGPAQGSTFRMEVPAASPGSDAAAPPAASAPRRASGARVLVVDDNRDSAESLGELLAMIGFRCRVAYDGEAAVQAVQQEPPDAVLLDIGLPDIDGYEVCHRIRNSPLARQPVMIALTGWGQDRDRERATGAGFDAHLTKPAEPDRIIALLEQLLDQPA
jgi:CheY-like chemotaxis protein